ncbi:MAG TPA: LuxR family transcriptional regulator [Sphingomonas sp.]|jgi:DNA-binding CsgD family transcriptional regulator|nr:LuxR family transcriptional regulator [Sphingomonas sp.]
MGMHAMGQFIRAVDAAANSDDLAVAMVEICAILGFQYFALTHHVDILNASSATIRLHNYPAQWADYYDEQALGICDPVHRASHVRSLGFPWSRMHDLIILTAGDRRVLALGSEQGIGDGFTVPANVPGETLGSCSFANAANRPLPEAMLPMAQLAGQFAFEAARRLWSVRKINEEEEAPVLTDRQRDCILWAARGKGDWEISRILGVSEETVARHIKQACERYGVNKRTLVAIRALFDGTLTFTDIFKR